MRRFLQFIIANPIAVVLLLAMALLAGVFALLHLPVGYHVHCCGTAVYRIDTIIPWH